MVFKLIPSSEGTSKKKDSVKDQRFRHLFKKRKSALILGVFVFGFIAFGIGKSLSLLALLIVCSPFFVIFWSSFGEYLIDILKLKK